MSASARSTADEIYGGECISKNAYHPRQGLMLAQAIVELPMQSKGVHNKSVLLSVLNVRFADLGCHACQVSSEFATYLFIYFRQNLRLALNSSVAEDDS